MKCDRGYPDAFSEEKVKNFKSEGGKGKNGTKIELEVVYPPLYDKNAMLLKLAADERITGISG